MSFTTHDKSKTSFCEQSTALATTTTREKHKIHQDYHIRNLTIVQANCF